MGYDFDMVAFRRGDNQEFERIYESLRPNLQYFAEKYIGDVGAAEDIVIVAFGQLFNRCQHFEAAYSINSFLYKTVRNACLNHLTSEKRRKKREKGFQQLIESDENEMSMLEIVDREVVKQALEVVKSLPKTCRKIFELSVFNDLSPKQIAQRLDTNVGNVHSHLYNAWKVVKSFGKNQ